MTDTHPPALDPATIRTALDQARQTALQIDGLRAANARIILTLEAAFNQALNGALNALPEPFAPVSEHRRAHRPGTPPKIAGDVELQAFIAARIDRLTFEGIAAEVAQHFPISRRVGMTAIWEWWRKSQGRDHRKRR